MTTIYKDNQHIILSEEVEVAYQENLQLSKKARFDPLQPIRQWLDNIEISDAEFALFLYKAIPSQCPFARDIKIFGHKVAHIPPLCKLNPLYDQLVSLRFRALCYLVDRCGVDIQ